MDDKSDEWDIHLFLIEYPSEVLYVVIRDKKMQKKKLMKHRILH